MGIRKKIISVFQNHKSEDTFSHIRKNTLTVRSLEYLSKAMGWTKQPLIEGDYLENFDYLEDLNGRRRKDAEVVNSACANGNIRIALEIGTSSGRMTALMAQNASNATIYTVNIPPEEIEEGGKFTTYAPNYDTIGKYYKEKGLQNVKQILANTATWEPDFGPIDVAFIDGSHDADFVYNDTRKILQQCKPGSIVMWHDFNPSLIPVYPWIADVCRGVERLYQDKLIKGKILHLQDSWVGLYKIT